jgi:hypothetical protein
MHWVFLAGLGFGFGSGIILTNLMHAWLWVRLGINGRAQSKAISVLVDERRYSNNRGE